MRGGSQQLGAGKGDATHIRLGWVVGPPPSVSHPSYMSNNVDLKGRRTTASASSPSLTLLSRSSMDRVVVTSPSTPVHTSSLSARHSLDMGNSLIQDASLRTTHDRRCGMPRVVHFRHPGTSVRKTPSQQCPVKETLGPQPGP
eukprot:1157212-Pelagomonas_calceolata.AAC.5